MSKGWDTCLKPYRKIYSEEVEDLNIGAGTVGLLEGNMGRFHDSISNEIMNLTAKHKQQ